MSSLISAAILLYHVCMCVCVYVCMYVCMYVYVCTFVCMYVCMHAFVLILWLANRLLSQHANKGLNVIIT